MVQALLVEAMPLFDIPYTNLRPGDRSLFYTHSPPFYPDMEIKVLGIGFQVDPEYDDKSGFFVIGGAVCRRIVFAIDSDNSSDLITKTVNDSYFENGLIPAMATDIYKSLSPKYIEPATWISHT